MLIQRKTNAVVSDYRILDFAGKTAERMLYLAFRRQVRAPYWLVEAEKPEALPNDVPEPERFQFENRNFLAFGVAGTPIAQLLQIVPSFDWKFITSQWVILAQSFGYLHARGQVYQAQHSFSFGNLVFDNAAQVLPVSYLREDTTPRFSSPEAASGTLTPASDVYSLGATLLALIGVASPQQLIAKGVFTYEQDLGDILLRATASDPAERYRTGKEFAQALSVVVPSIDVSQPRLTSQPKTQLGLSPASLVAFAGLAIFLLVVTLGFGLWMVKQVQSVALEAPPRSEPIIIPVTGEATPTPIAALQGPLDFDLLALSFSPECQSRMDIRIKKGTPPIPDGVAVSFDAFANDKPVLLAQQTKVAAAGQYHLEFPSAPICANGGKLQLKVNALGESAAKSFYFDPNPTAVPKLALSAMQVDTQTYPLITVYFSLVGPDGSAARLAGPSQVQIAQDNLPVSDFTMTLIDPKSNPVTVALVLDVSGSMRGQPLVDARTAAAEFISQLGERDLACLYTFSTQVARIQNCTQDRRATTGALNNLTAGNNTALYDVLGLVANDHAKLAGRQAIIVLSDGADTASKSTLNDALNRLKQTNVPVYAVGLVSKDYNRAVLRQVAAAAGGTQLEAPKSTDLRALYNQIQGQIKTQYRVIFRSLFPDPRNGNITIRITNANQVIELNRPYFAK